MEKVQARKSTKSLVQVSECGGGWMGGGEGDCWGERECRGVQSEWVKEDFGRREWSSTPCSSSLEGNGIVGESLFLER